MVCVPSSGIEHKCLEVCERSSAALVAVTIHSLNFAGPGVRRHAVNCAHCTRCCSSGENVPVDVQSDKLLVSANFLTRERPSLNSCFIVSCFRTGGPFLFSAARGCKPVFPDEPPPPRPRTQKIGWQRIVLCCLQSMFRTPSTWGTPAGTLPGWGPPPRPDPALLTWPDHGLCQCVLAFVSKAIPGGANHRNRPSVHKSQAGLPSTRIIVEIDLNPVPRKIPPTCFVQLSFCESEGFCFAVNEQWTWCWVWRIWVRAGYSGAELPTNSSADWRPTRGQSWTWPSLQCDQDCRYLKLFCLGGGA